MNTNHYQFKLSRNDVIRFLIPVFLILVFSIGLALKISAELNLQIEPIRKELRGVEQIQNLLNSTSSATSPRFDKIKLRQISEDSEIILDPTINSYYLGHFLTHLFPDFSMNPKDSDSIEALKHAVEMGLPDCSTACGSFDLRAQEYKSKVLKMIENPKSESFHTLYFEGLGLFKEQLQQRLSVAEKNYSFVFIIYIIVASLAVGSRLFVGRQMYRRLKNEHSLRRNLENAQQIGKIGSWKFWIDSKKMEWSNQLFQIFQIDPNIAPEEHFQKYLSRIHPEDRKSVQDTFQSSIQSGGAYQIEHRIILDDGSIRWILGRGEASKDLAGNVDSLFGTAQDLTDQIMHQEAYLTTLEKMSEAQRTAKIGSWEFNLLTHEQTWSEEHYRIFEIPMPQSQETLHQMYRERIHSDDLPELDKITQNALEKGIGFTYNHRVVLDDGRRIKHVQGIGQVKKDSQGKPIAIHGTCQDITERVEKDKENQFTLDALGLGVWRFNPQTQALVWDQSMYRLFEIEPHQFSGDYQAWESSLTAEAREKAITELGQALSGEKEFNTTFEIQVKGGRKKYIGGRGQVVRSESGAPLMMYGLNWDRTKEVELEQKIDQERSKAAHNSKLASLGEMSAGVAHEINNPLTVIVGNLKLLKKYKDDPVKFDEKLDAMKKSGERIAKIVRGLSKFARTSENAEQKPETITSLVDEVIVITESKSKRTSTPVTTNIRSQSSILCDGIEIEQVLVNLINNGIDAVSKLDDKWVKLNAFDEGEELVVQVIDSGAGISPELEAKLFQPFFTTKAVGEGTGLGLSIAKGILDQHKAQISIRRDFKNTCFEIRFPAVKAA